MSGIKKTVKEIGCTALAMCVICAVFWKLHWITSLWQAVFLFGITAAVIVCDLLGGAAVRWLRKKMFKPE